MMPPGSRASLADSLLVLFASCPAHAFAGEFDAVGIVNETVQDGLVRVKDLSKMCKSVRKGLLRRTQLRRRQPLVDLRGGF
jgi:hypothetical protein